MQSPCCLVAREWQMQTTWRLEYRATDTSGKNQGNGKPAQQALIPCAQARVMDFV
jgi:hypothetical protein